MKMRKCVQCGKQVKTRCSKCREVYYCSVEHQRLHWRTHKNECVSYKLVDNNNSSSSSSGSSHKEEEVVAAVDQQSQEPQQSDSKPSPNVEHRDVDVDVVAPNEIPSPSLDFLPKRGDAKPTCILIVGMAGSGKTRLMQRLSAHVSEHKLASYIVNLDPAVLDVPYEANIDIRDTVKYKDVMKDYKLGPNGAIMTSLNLFATRFDQVMSFVRNQEESLRYAIFDTPGQIEVFTWSASGSIITESLASEYPTVVLYVVDTPRTASPVTFMSNMLHACSIMYKTKLPFIVVFNKIDVMSHEFAVEWMDDFDVFSTALAADKSYMSTFTRSMSLVLDEFYRCLTHVGVSAATGQGVHALFDTIDKARDEYFTDYLSALRARIEKKMADEASEKEEQARRLLDDMRPQQSQNNSDVPPSKEDNQERAAYEAWMKQLDKE